MRDTIAMYFGPESRGIECVYIDALFDENDEIQVLKFNEETENLYDYLSKRDELPIMAIPTCKDNRLKKIDPRPYQIKPNEDPENILVEPLLDQENHYKGT